MKKFLCLLLLTLFTSTVLPVFAQHVPGGASGGGSSSLTTPTVTTYSASSALTTPVASTTDMLMIAGSSTKKIHILRIEAVYTTSTAGNIAPTYLIKRSTLDTTGTATTLTDIPFDSGDAAGTAVVKCYTANPGGLGTSVGQVAITSLSSSVSGVVASDIQFPLQTLFDATMYGKPLILNSATECVCVNFAGTIPGGSTPLLAFNVYWTEQ
jgi:hypothetical protein